MRWGILSLAFVATAIAAEPQPAVAPTATPPVDPRVHFRIKFPGSQSEFHIGERISIQLLFSSNARKTFEINEATYDRSGRMNYEHFQITPAKGWLDPIPADAFSIAGGALTNTEYLTPKPWGIQVDLNDWVRFDEPGNYTLTVFSDRLSIFDGASRYSSSEVTAKSNEIKFKIVPADAAWQKRTLDQAVATLSKPKVSKEEEDVAWAVLRYLGTPGAAVELAKGLGTQRAHFFGSDVIYGLIASPAREAAREAVEKEIANPDRPIDETFLFTLQFLYLGANSTEKEQAAARSKADQQLIAALPNKRGTALGPSLALAFEEVATKDSTSPDLLAKLRDQIVGLFDHLQPDEQMPLLEDSNWEKIRTPDLAASLKKLATANPDELKPRNGDFWSANDVSALALRRWYELAPEEARPFVLQEITKPVPRYGAGFLGFLPDKSLPEVGEKLADNLLHLKNYEGTEEIVSLIVRYATPAAYPNVVKAVDASPTAFGHGWSSRIFVYLLKINPAETEIRMEKTLSLLHNDDFAYNPDFFGTIAQVDYDPVLERVAIRHLNDPRLNLEMAAVRMLGAYGSAAAEQPLLRRYEKWNHDWASKVSKNRNIVSRKSPLDDQTRLGEDLLDALAAGVGWFYGPVELQRLKEMNNISTFQAKIEALKQSLAEKPITVGLAVAGEHFVGFVADNKPPSFELLKQKLLQFPAGTTFALNFYDNQDKKERDLLRELQQFLRDRGYMVIDEKH
jgi:hypothetical protein